MWAREVRCKQSVLLSNWIFLTRMKNQEKNQSIIQWYWYSKCGVMNASLECFFTAKLKLWNTFNYRVGDTNAVTQRA